MQQWTPSDAQSWEMTKATLKHSDETSARFLVFLNFWLNTAEKMMADGALGTPGDEGYLPALTPANAIRAALEVAEARLGFIDVWFLGQLLACIGTYWQHGDALCQQMSPIELKLTGEALRIKMDDMSIQAMEETGEPLRVSAQSQEGIPDDAAQQSIDPLDEPDRRQGAGLRESDGQVGVAGGGQEDPAGSEDGGPRPVRNRLNERPGGKGGRPLDRRPSRATETGTGG